MAAILETEIIKMAGDALRAFAPHIPCALPPDGEHHQVKTYWYTPAEQFVVELILVHLFGLPFINWLTRSNWKVAVPKARSPSNDALWLRLLDGLLQVCCVVNGILIVLYKVPTGRWMYLFQPCHLQNFAYIYLMLFDKDKRKHSRLFHFLLMTWYGAWLALATPDLRGQTMFFEVENFFIEHIMLTILPAVWIIRRKYDVFEGIVPVTWTWAVFWLMHMDLFAPVSLYSGGNVNYVLVPPNGPLRLAGAFYRPAMGVICWLIPMFLRYVVVDLILDVFKVRLAAKQEAVEGSPDSPVATATPVHRKKE